ncbi:MAG: hypothetical protein IIC53_04215, partial [Proteobacteria bacterium]|nr:hypothetical protein [Pseudomonadota bacterium]
MQAIKGFVVFMGLLIVAGLALVVYALMTRVSDGAGSSDGFDATTVPLPAGCTLAEARIEAGRLILRTAGPAERRSQQVLLLD